MAKTSTVAAEAPRIPKSLSRLDVDSNREDVIKALTSLQRMAELGIASDRISRAAEHDEQLLVFKRKGGRLKQIEYFHDRSDGMVLCPLVSNITVKFEGSGAGHAFVGNIEIAKVVEDRRLGSPEPYRSAVRYSVDEAGALVLLERA